MDRLKVNIPYLVRYSDGRIYVRRYGRKIALKSPLGSDDFFAEYRVAVDKLARHHRLPTTAVVLDWPLGSVGDLAMRYFASREFARIEHTFARARKAIIKECLREPGREGGNIPMGNCPIDQFTAAKVKRLRDLKMATGALGAANNRRKAISAMFGWAIEEGLAEANPVRDVRPIKYTTGGFHPWSVDEVLQFEARHPIGTRARLAIALFLYTGARRGDVVLLGPQHLKDDVISFTPSKTRHLGKGPVHLPVVPELAKIIAASTVGHLAFLVTEYGRPFSAKGFGHRFGKWCDEAGLPEHCTAHGLRKAGATLAAERGATAHQLAALFGWSNINQAQPYTATADRRRLAAEGVKFLRRDG